MMINSVDRMAADDSPDDAGSFVTYMASKHGGSKPRIARKGIFAVLSLSVATACNGQLYICKARCARFFACHLPR